MSDTKTAPQHFNDLVDQFVLRVEAGEAPLPFQAVIASAEYMACHFPSLAIFDPPPFAAAAFDRIERAHRCYEANRKRASAC